MANFKFIYPGIHAWIGHYCEELGLPLKSIDRDACGIKVDTGFGRYRVHRHTLEKYADGDYQAMMNHILDVHKRICANPGTVFSTSVYFPAGLV